MGNQITWQPACQSISRVIKNSIEDEEEETEAAEDSQLENERYLASLCIFCSFPRIGNCQKLLLQSIETCNNLCLLPLFLCPLHSIYISVSLSLLLLQLKQLASWQVVAALRLFFACC